MKIIHVWQHGGKLSADTAIRNAVARATWEKVYTSGNWVERRLDDNVLTRTSATEIPGEKMEFPFLHDLFRYACFGSPNDQIIVYTNADNLMAENIEERLMEMFNAGIPAIHGSRRDFKEMESPIHYSEYEKGEHYAGTDLVAFRAGWWRKHVGEMPDMCLASESWDHVMRELINLRGGQEIKLALAHNWHPSFWEVNRLTLPVNIYNRNLARAFLKKHNLPLLELSFSEPQLSTQKYK